MVDEGTIRKEDVLRNMRRTGLQELLPEAEKRLPDVIDVRRDQELLVSLGLSRTGMMDALGGSP